MFNDVTFSDDRNDERRIPTVNVNNQQFRSTWISSASFPTPWPDSLPFSYMENARAVGTTRLDSFDHPIVGQVDHMIDTVALASSVVTDQPEMDHQGRVMEDSSPRCGGVHDGPHEHLSKITTSVSHPHNEDLIVPPPSSPEVGDSEIDPVASASELSLPLTTVAVGAVHGVADGRQSQQADSIVTSVGVVLPRASSPLPEFGTIAVGSSKDATDEQKPETVKNGDVHHISHLVLPRKKIITSMLESPKSGSSTPKKSDLNRGDIDTASHFESVKESGSKFGVMVRWKSCRALDSERCRYTGQDLEKLQEEMVVYKKRSVDVEAAKIQVLKVLDSTNREINELKQSLERAQTEEQQAKQDSELAMLREEEMEQGICDEASVAAKQQLEVAKARHAAAVEELKSINEELETLRNEYASMVTERDTAVKKAEEAVSASKEVEKRVEELTFDLMATKESLGSANAAHVGAEEKRIEAAHARDQDTRHWEEDLKQAEEELQKVTQQIQSAEDLKPTLDTASELLHDLKAELTAHTESKFNLENNGHSADASGTPEKRTLTEIPAVDTSAKELEEVKLKIEKTTAEVDSLKVLAVSLKSELEKEEYALATIKQTEGMSDDVASLKDDTESKIASARMNGKEARDKMVEVPKQLQQATQEALEAKSLAQTAHEELRKVKEEAEQAKARASTMESRLLAVQKEIEAAEASKKLAVDAIKALQDHESAQRTENDDLPDGVILPLEEYYDLSKRAYEAEEQAHMKLAAVISQAEVAKRSQSSSLEELEEANRQMVERNEQLKIALEKAQKAKEGKLGVEQELRQWRAEHEQPPKATESSHGGSPPSESSEGTEQTKKAEPVPTSPCSTLDSSKAINPPSESFEGTEQTKKAEPVPTSPCSTLDSSKATNPPSESSEGTEQTKKAEPAPTSPCSTLDSSKAINGSSTESESSPETVVVKKKKKQLFPKIVTFFSRKKSSLLKSKSKS
ncbi:hypothetical protein GQ457_13G008880 [Hibiscus cannabinus]